MLFSDIIEYKCKENVSIPKEIFSKKSGTVCIVFLFSNYVTRTFLEGEEYKQESFYVNYADSSVVELRYEMIDENTVNLKFGKEQS